MGLIRALERVLRIPSDKEIDEAIKREIHRALYSKVGGQIVDVRCERGYILNRKDIQKLAMLSYNSFLEFQESDFGNC